jgi:hypothetical protein
MLKLLDYAALIEQYTVDSTAQEAKTPEYP